MNLPRTKGVRQNPRQSRYFSESFKREKVKQLEQNLIRVTDICREYQVSKTSVYRWLDKYSVLRTKKVRQVIEPMSDSKKIKALRQKVAELERLIGQKQIEIEFKDKLIEIAEEMYDVDIKKKLGSQLSSGSGATEIDTHSK